MPDDAPFEQLGDVTQDWAAGVRERMARYQPPFDSGLVELGATLLETLPEGGRTVVIHGDFNPGNLLASQREPFLAIDAKPMIGDAAYDPKPLLDQLGDPFDADDAAGVLGARYRLFADLVELPVARMLAWSVARSVESALWNLSGGRLGDAERSMREARLLATAGDV